MYEALRKDSNKPTQMLHFYCPHPCNSLANKFLLSMAKLESKIDQLSDEVQNINSKMTKLEGGELTPAMVEAVKRVTQPLVQVENEGGEALQDILEIKSKEQLAELEDRVRRKANLMIFRLPEDLTDRIVGRRKDRETIQTLISDIKWT